MFIKIFYMKLICHALLFLVILFIGACDPKDSLTAPAQSSLFIESSLNDIRMQKDVFLDSTYIGDPKIGFESNFENELISYDDKYKFIKSYNMGTALNCGYSSKLQAHLFRTPDGELLKVTPEFIDSTGLDVTGFHRFDLRDSILISMNAEGDFSLTNTITNKSISYKKLLNKGWVDIDPKLNIIYTSNSNKICSNCLLRFHGTTIDMANATKLDPNYKLSFIKNYVQLKKNGNKEDRNTMFFQFVDDNLVKMHEIYFPNEFPLSERVEYSYFDESLILVKGENKKVLFNTKKNKIIGIYNADRKISANHRSSTYMVSNPNEYFDFNGQNLSEDQRKDKMNSSKKYRDEIIKRQKSICRIYSKDLEFVSDSLVKVPIRFSAYKEGYINIKANKMTLHSFQKDILTPNGHNGIIIGVLNDKVDIILEKYGNKHSKKNKYRILLLDRINSNNYLVITRNTKGTMINDVDTYRYIGEQCKIHIPKSFNYKEKDYGLALGINLSIEDL